VSASRPIAFLTDFGEDDFYAGVLRAVAASIAPASARIDISHEVRAHDVHLASFVLALSFDYLPRDTVVVAVVDPGVGGARRAVVAEFGTRCVVAPDNGLLSDLLVLAPDARIVAVRAFAQVRGGRHHAPGAPEPFEPRGEGGIPQGVVVHDDPASGPVHHAQQVVDAALDRAVGQVALDVRGRPGEIEERRPLLDEPGDGDRRQRALHVGGEDEALALGAVHDGERHHVPQRRALHAVRQRRRHRQLDRRLAAPPAVGGPHGRHALQRAPQRGAAPPPSSR